MAKHFTSDSHFGHANIIKYCNRPYANVEEMDEALIKNWNAVVAPGDDVYHMGDIMFKCKKDKAEWLLDRLNGNLYLIYGNHDHTAKQIERRFGWKKDYFEIPSQKGDDGHPVIVLCHYAFRVWNHAHHGSWHLYGHSHGTLPDDPTSLSFDVGVDSHNYRPISLEEVRSIMNRKKFVPKDHHGSEQSERMEREANPGIITHVNK